VIEAAHALLLARVVIGLVFAVSASAKLRDLPAFAAAVEDFRIVARRWAGLTASIVVGLEGAVALSMVAGHALLLPAFALAAALLAGFSVALGVAVRRRRVVSCNCFGSAATRLSGYDIARNVCLIACAAAGAGTVTDDQSLPAAELAATVLAGAGVALVLVNFADIARTLRRPFTLAGVT
jgi:uncharacterized membrane protein YphA (DoxX/SURF4 family)